MKCIVEVLNWIKSYEEIHHRPARQSSSVGENWTCVRRAPPAGYVIKQSKKNTSPAFDDKYENYVEE